MLIKDELNEGEEDQVNLELDIDETAKQIESQEVQELKKELAKVIEPIVAPPMFPPHPVKCLEPESYPITYNSNTKKEELVLEYVENFKKQFQYIYPDRKSLYMMPYNECGVAKFVCSYVRTTTLKFSQFYDWRECAQFVADYLEYLPFNSNFTELVSQQSSKISKNAI